MATPENEAKIKYLSRYIPASRSKKQSAPPKQETSFDLDEYERTSSWGFFEEGSKE